MIDPIPNMQKSNNILGVLLCHFNLARLITHYPSREIVYKNELYQKRTQRKIHKLGCIITPRNTNSFKIFNIYIIAYFIVLQATQINFNTLAQEVYWTGDVIITTNESYNSQIIYLDGNLTIINSLILEKVNLELNCKMNGSIRILVKSTGSLSIQNSTIESLTDSSYLFQIEPKGSLMIDSSIIHDCGWDDPFNSSNNSLSQRGLYIQSTNVKLTNSTFSNNCAGMIIDNGCRPTIHHNDINNNSVSGIEIYAGSTPVIESNIVHDNFQHTKRLIGMFGGIYVDNSTPIIANNTIYSNNDRINSKNSNGIYINNSDDLQIKFNNISNHRGIEYYTGTGILCTNSSPLIEQNIISNNANGIFLYGGSAIIINNIMDHNSNLPDSSEGFGLLDSSDSECNNNTFSNNTYGVCLSDSSNTIFKNNTFKSNIIAGITGYDIYSPFTNIFLNCTFMYNGWDINFNISPDYSTGHIDLINSNFNVNLTDMGSSQSSMTVKWFLLIKVAYQRDDKPVDSAILTILDSKGNTKMVTETKIDGSTDSMILEEYSINGYIKSIKSPYSVIVKKDNFKNQSQVDLNHSKNLFVTIDNIPPWFEIQHPENNSFYNKSVITICGTSEPDCIISVRNDSVNVGSNGTWVLETSLPDEGLNILTVRATDPSGNIAETTSYVIRDTIAPNMTLLTPKNGFITKDTHLIVSGYASELDVMISINNKTFSSDPEGSFEIQWELAEGNNVLQIRCVDRANNSDEIVVSGIRDSIAPILDIIEPANNSITNIPLMTLKMNADPNALITIGSRQYNPVSGSLQIELSLQEGLNIFVIQACDGAGNINIVSLYIQLDTTNPAIALTSTKDNEVVNCTFIWINGSTEAGARIKIDGVIVETNGSSFSHRLRLEREGRNEITIEAVDSAENEARMVISIFLDTVPPLLELDEVISGYLTNNRSVYLSGKTEAGASLSINGNKNAVFRDGHFGTSIELDNEGPNPIHFIATDPAGNKNEAEIVIVRDTVISCNITAPKNGMKVKSDFITITGTTEPDAMVEAGIHRTKAMNDGSFSLRVDLKNGKNIINVKVIDPAGNEWTTALLVEKTNPQSKKSFIPAFEIQTLLLVIIVYLVGIRRKR